MEDDKKYLPVLWKPEPQFEVDRQRRAYFYLYNIIMHQIEIKMQEMYHNSYPKPRTYESRRKK
jgi:hypothetical protein